MSFYDINEFGLFNFENFYTNNLLTNYSIKML